MGATTGGGAGGGGASSGADEASGHVGMGFAAYVACTGNALVLPLQDLHKHPHFNRRIDHLLGHKPRGTLIVIPVYAPRSMEKRGAAGEGGNGDGDGDGDDDDFNDDDENDNFANDDRGNSAGGVRAGKRVGGGRKKRGKIVAVIQVIRTCSLVQAGGMEAMDEGQSFSNDDLFLLDVFARFLGPMILRESGVVVGSAAAGGGGGGGVSNGGAGNTTAGAGENSALAAGGAVAGVPRNMPPAGNGGDASVPLARGNLSAGGEFAAGNLLELAQTIFKDLNLGKLTRTIMQSSKRMTNADRGTIFLLSDDGERLVPLETDAADAEDRAAGDGGGGGGDANRSKLGTKGTLSADKEKAASDHFKGSSATLRGALGASYKNILAADNFDAVVSGGAQEGKKKKKKKKRNRGKYGQSSIAEGNEEEEGEDGEKGKTMVSGAGGGDSGGGDDEGDDIESEDENGSSNDSASHTDASDYVDSGEEDSDAASGDDNGTNEQKEADRSGLQAVEDIRRQSGIHRGVSLHVKDLEKPNAGGTIAGSGGAATGGAKKKLGISAHVALTGETLNIPDAYHYKNFDRSWDAKTGYRTRSVLCVAIRKHSGEVLGAIMVINKLTHTPFTQQDESTMDCIAKLTAIAVENSQVFHQTQEICQRFAEISAVTELDDAADRVEGLSCLIMRARKTRLFLKDDQNGEIFSYLRDDHAPPSASHAASSSSRADRVVFRDSLLRGSVVGRVFKKGVPATIHHQRQKILKAGVDRPVGYGDIKSTTFVPIRDPTTDKVVAVLQFIDKENGGRFTVEDENFLRMVAEQSYFVLSHSMENKNQATHRMLVAKMQQGCNYLFETLSAPHIVHNAVLLIQEILGVDRCDFFLYGEEMMGGV